MANAKKTCSVENCNRDAIALELCTMHYQRQKKSGTTVLKVRERKIVSFIKSLGQTSNCELWPFAISKTSGYGVTLWNGIQTSAHRASLIHHYGPPPSDGMHAAHDPKMCKSILCCNPKHLRWATPAENNNDKILAGTFTRGVQASTSNLSEIDVLNIFNSTETVKYLSDFYGVHKMTVSRIKSGFTWAWLTGATYCKRDQ